MSFSRQIMIVAILAAVGAAGYYSWPLAGTENASSKAKSGATRKPVAVEASAASMQRIDRIVEAVGTTRAVRSVQIAPLLAGRVVSHGCHTQRKSRPDLFCWPWIQ